MHETDAVLRINVGDSVKECLNCAFATMMPADKVDGIARYADRLDTEYRSCCAISEIAASQQKN